MSGLYKALGRSPPASLDEIRSIVKAEPNILKCFAKMSFCDVNVLPLHFACMNHAPLEIVSYLVEMYPESIKIQSRGLLPGSMLPLHHACFEGASLEVIKYLITIYPASIKIMSGDGSLPLHIACYSAFSGYRSTPLLETIQFLVETYPEAIMVKSTSHGHQGRLPLHIASLSKASLEVVQYLAERNPESIKVADEQGYLPLHRLCCAMHCFRPRLESVQYFVKTFPASIKMKDMFERLPLHHACAYGGALDVVQYLVLTYPWALHARDKNGDTPFKLAHGKPLVAPWIESYMTIRWFRVGECILLRSLVDQQRACLVVNKHARAQSKRQKTCGEWELLVEFIYVSSPAGVFALIMCYM